MDQSLDDLFSNHGIDANTMPVDTAMKNMEGSGYAIGFAMLEQDDE